MGSDDLLLNFIVYLQATLGEVICASQRTVLQISHIPAAPTTSHVLAKVTAYPTCCVPATRAGRVMLVTNSTVLKLGERCALVKLMETAPTVVFACVPMTGGT